VLSSRVFFITVDLLKLALLGKYSHCCLEALL